MSPDTKGSAGLPVVMYACMYCQHDSPPGREAIALALIAAKANVNVKDDNDSTPLIWAMGSCGVEVVQALIDAGANVNARAKGGATPLMMARAMQRDDLVPLLEKAGAKE
jgi:ankyrin repeat protein